MTVIIGFAVRPVTGKTIYIIIAAFSPTTSNNNQSKATKNNDKQIPDKNELKSKVRLRATVRCGMKKKSMQIWWNCLDNAAKKSQDHRFEIFHYRSSSFRKQKKMARLASAFSDCFGESKLKLLDKNDFNRVLLGTAKFLRGCYCLALRRHSRNLTANMSQTSSQRLKF